jgi:hypothetical protein
MPDLFFSSPFPATYIFVPVILNNFNIFVVLVSRWTAQNPILTELNTPEHPDHSDASPWNPSQQLSKAPY